MTPSEPDRFDIFHTTPQRHWQLAEQAYEAGHDTAATAHLGIVTVHQTSGILRLLEALTNAVVATPQWTVFRDTDATPLHCTCGNDAFSEYPTRTEQQLTWWVCANPDCDAIWSIGNHPFSDPLDAPSLVSGGVDDFHSDPAWNIHDLVRHRPHGQVGEMEHRPVEYVAILQSRDSDDPGWWNAQILRVVNPPRHTPPPQVGQGVRLREGTPVNRVARFP